MDGIKGIAEILESPPAGPSPPVIHPNREQGQHGQPLLREGELQSSQRDWKLHPAHQHAVDDPQPSQLRQPAKGQLPAHPEQQHRQHPQTAVVHHRQLAQNIAQPAGHSKGQIAPETAFFRPSPGQTQHQQGQTEGEQHVLMEGIDHIPPVHQIKGDLGDQGKQKDPPKISFEMMGAGKALRDLEGKDGKSQPAYTGHPRGPGNHCGPHMVTQHQRHRQ